jgi:hypothetical protein
MSISAAKLSANRRNARLSTGPRTPEGKERSRRNALKHGLTGEGVVLPTEDQAEVDRRFEALEAELAPSVEMGLILVRRVATLSVQMERCVHQETAMLGEKVRHASEEFDDRRMASVEKMFDWIASEPATNSRRLRQSPEGVDRLIKAWLDLAYDLDCPDPRRWGYSHWQRMENLNGRRPEDFPMSRDGALCKLLGNDSSFLEAGEVEGLDLTARHEWARAKLRERIDAEVAKLHQVRESFDFETLAIDRAEAATRAMFDPSKEAILARKYEAAAERGMYRALAELRQVEAEAAEGIESDATLDGEFTCDTVGSFETEAEDDTPEPVPHPKACHRNPRESGYFVGRRFKEIPKSVAIDPPCPA